MDQGTRSKLGLEKSRTLVLLSGISVALIFLIQYHELPHPRALYSLFVNGGLPMTLDTVGKIALPDSLNSTSVEYGTASRKKGDGGSEHAKSSRQCRGSEISKVYGNGSNENPNDGLPLDYDQSLCIELGKGAKSNNNNDSANFPALEKAEESRNAITLKNLIKDMNISGISIQRQDVALTDQSNGNSHKPSPIISFQNKTISTYAASESKSLVISADSADITSKRKYRASMTNKDENAIRYSTSKRKRRLKRPVRVVSISKMNKMLLKLHAFSHSMETRWSSIPDREILSAKLEIENAPTIKDDKVLHLPLFRNLSMFKRSYELMENMLKVYIYEEGEKPIFHQPLLRGIYASEGWFMKLLEANKNFVTKDPTKAHLFYLPFSSQLLKLTLNARNSHSRKDLSKYLKDYVGMIASKYSFWNRAGGADHFVVACHDSAPFETRGSMPNSIRALCNTDIEVGFRIGKDVSLPETFIHTEDNPLKNIGGNPPSQRPILAFFAGNMHGYLRPIMLKYWENKDPDMKIFGRISSVHNNTNYIQYMKNSKYCISAKGFEVNSPRLVEAMFHECVPVIISDNYVPPFFEFLNWESFAVFVLEKDIPNLKNILVSISEKRYMEMHLRVKKVQQHFLWHQEPVKFDLFYMILHNIWYNRVFQVTKS